MQAGGDVDCTVPNWESKAAAQRVLDRFSSPHQEIGLTDDGQSLMRAVPGVGADERRWRKNVSGVIADSGVCVESLLG